MFLPGWRKLCKVQIIKRKSPGPVGLSGSNYYKSAAWVIPTTLQKEPGLVFRNIKGESHERYVDRTIAVTICFNSNVPLYLCPADPWSDVPVGHYGVGICDDR